MLKWFEHKAPNWGRSSMFPLREIHAKDNGFLVNGELKIVFEIDILEVIGELGVSEKTSAIEETVEVHGFQVLPSQANYVSRMFERHPQIASNFRPKNSSLDTSYMSMLLSLIETICQLPKEMTNDDLSNAYAVLGFLRNAGFNLDWLKKKLDEVLEKKQNVEASETMIKDMEEALKDLKQKSSTLEAEMEEALKDLKQKSSTLEAEMQTIQALVENEKEKISVAKAPISFDDVL